MCTLQEAWPPPPKLPTPAIQKQVVPQFQPMPQFQAVPPPSHYSRLAVVKEVEEDAEKAAADMTVLIVVGFTVLFLTMVLGFSVYGSRLEKRMDQILYMLMMIKSRG